MFLLLLEGEGEEKKAWEWEGRSGERMWGVMEREGWMAMDRKAERMARRGVRCIIVRFVSCNWSEGVEGTTLDVSYI